MQLAFQRKRFLFAVDAAKPVGKKGSTEQIHKSEAVNPDHRARYLLFMAES